jgi:N-acetylglutamate synthase-like GNAT family acetyltransferase
MPAQATIRLAKESDIPRLIELLAQLSLDEPRERMDESAADVYVSAFDEIAGDPRQQLFVLEAGGRVVGSACLIIIPNLTHQGRPYALAENVVVDADSRSSGYGELLMRHIMQKARAAGCYKLALTSNKQRPDAHRFYQRLGFSAASEGFRVEFE